MKKLSEAENPLAADKTLLILRVLFGLGRPILGLFLILLVLLNLILRYFPHGWIFEAPALLLVLNTIFISAIPLFIAYLAFRSHRRGGPPQLLFLGCGMLTFALTSLIAGWYGDQAQANINLTIHNTGVLATSVFLFLGAIVSYFENPTPRRKVRRKESFAVFAYMGIGVLAAVLLLSALYGYSPPFYIQGAGSTFLREIVLAAAAIFFGSACLLVVIFNRFKKSFFLAFYALALAMITIGIIALMTSVQANSVLSWLGRSAQYTAGIYFLAASVAVIQAAWANRWTVPDTFADFFRPSEALHREVVETATDAIMQVSPSGEIFLWNRAAERIFGYDHVEFTRLTFFDLVDPEDLKNLLRDVEMQRKSRKTRLVREIKARRKTGEEFPAEFSISSRLSMRGLILVLFARDVTERKRAEEELRRSRDELELRVQERTEELAKSRKRLHHLASQLILAQEKERKRIAVELHDGLLSELAAIKMLHESKMKLLEEGTLEDPSEFKKVSDILAGVIKETRGIMNNLHPSVLDELGLIAGIHWLAGEYEKKYSHIKVQKQFEVSEQDISLSLRIVIFRVFQEALNNFAKYGKGDLINLSLTKPGGALALVVRDNGQGFNVEKAEKGVGLESMRERVELSGGEFHLESAIGRGTTIRATWAHS